MAKPKRGCQPVLVSDLVLPERAATWAASIIGAPDARVHAVAALRPDGSPWLIDVSDGGRTTRAVLKTGTAGMREELATEEAALRLAHANDLPAPLVLGSDFDGERAGCLALLMTYVDGSDRIPVVADQHRLRAIGAAAAAIHSVQLEPTEELPLRQRPMPWVNFSELRRTQTAHTTTLLQRGDDLLSELTPPVVEPVFVHGDLWAGNLLWREGACVGTIDWEAAGAGSYGVDLGSLRLDAALLYGDAAPEQVLAGWTSHGGRDAPDISYWDLVAALNTNANMAGALPTMHQAGRVDLDGDQLTARRDEFLREALAQLA